MTLYLNPHSDCLLQKFKFIRTCYVKNPNELGLA